MRKILLFFIDIALLYGSLLAMLLIRYRGEFEAQQELHLLPFGIIFALWLLIFYIGGLYDSRTLRNGVLFYSRLFESIAASTVIATSFFYLIPLFGINPKTNLALFILIFATAAFIFRSLFNNIFETKFKKNTIIVAEHEHASELAKFMADNPQLGYTLKDIIEPTDTAKLEEALKSSDLDTIVVSPEAYHLSKTTNIFYKVLGRKINFYTFPTFYERLTGRVPLGAIDQIWFLENLSEGSKKAYEALKRTVDITFGALFGLLSLLLYPLIIIAMQLDSPGPIFYKQTRIGRLGKPFELIKIRTMSPQAESQTGAVWAANDDPRVTRVGGFLRKSRLDEIPQFWNIIKGQMSLVGPRAERPEFHELLHREIPFYEERYLIKPGLSGWAQINYHYGSSVADAAEKLKYDLYYIKNRSFLLDIGIILKTLRTILSQAGK